MSKYMHPHKKQHPRVEDVVWRLTSSIKRALLGSCDYDRRVLLEETTIADPRSKERLLANRRSRYRGITRCDIASRVTF